MNRFRTRRRAKAADNEPVSNGAKLVKRNKASAPPSPPTSTAQIDLSAALPPSDDFRTSLLMSSMSARFSMLREQDDPNSKLGKASDDSVLAPRRASRLMDFGSSTKLSDIDETSSIKFRPPLFATRSETSDFSFVTDDDANTSMMGRSRPGEGNNLFGGRQKIYKIPVAGTKEGAVGGMGGRALYENDVSLSAFQKQRERERQREKEVERSRTEQDLISTSTWPSREGPPSPNHSAYNRNRETASSIASGPSGRTSTAATSIVSQGGSSLPSRARDDSAPTLPSLERTRSRRLYEQGLDRQLHDQQSSAMTRLEQISRQRALGGTPPPGLYSPLSHSSSATNLDERYGGSAPNTRPTSPPASSRTPSAAEAFDFGLSSSKASSPVIGPGPRLPLSPPISERGFNNSATSLVDRPKASPFTRPSQEYDDQQYSERQQLMQKASTEGPRSRSESANRRRALQLDSFDFTEEPKPSSSAYLQATTQKPFLSPASISDISSHGESETEGEKILSEFEPAASTSSRKLPTAGDMPRPNDADHPAFRQSSQPQAVDVSRLSGEPAAAADGPGLSGLVRQHLRNQSGASSNYADQSSPMTSRFFPDDFNVEREASRLSTHSVYASAGNPWRLPGEKLGPESPPIPSFMPSPLSIANSKNTDKPHEGVAEKAIDPARTTKAQGAPQPSDDYWKQEEEKIVRSVVRNQQPRIPSPQARRQERRAQEPRFRARGEVPHQIPRSRTTNNEPQPRKPSDPSLPSPSSASSPRVRSNSNSSAPAYFDKTLHPLNTGSSLSLSNTSQSPRPSPLTPFSANSTPPLDDLPATVPSNPPNFTQSTLPASHGRTKPINKADISEPSLFHTTNPMTNAVPLPAGTSLANGSVSSTPSVPAANSRRRHHAVFSAFSSSGSNGSASGKRTSPPVPAGGRSASEERSAFEEDEQSSMTSFKARLRKISSDGGTLRSRGGSSAASSTSKLPPLPMARRAGTPSPPLVKQQQRPLAVDGGMF